MTKTATCGRINLSQVEGEANMGAFLMDLGIIVLFVGTAVSIIVSLVFAIKRKNVKKPLVCIFLCIFLGIIFLNIGSDMWEKTDEYKELMEKKAKEEQNSEKKTEKIETEQNEYTRKIVTEEEQNSEIKSNIKPVTAGYSFETNDLNVVVNEIDTDFKGYDDEYGLNTPQSGMKYVMVSFTFQNTGDSDRYVGVDAFNCYADDELCDQVYTLDDKDFFNVNLSSGRKVSFNTYYSVPVSAQSIELEYETNILTDEKEVIKIQ